MRKTQVLRIDYIIIRIICKAKSVLSKKIIYKSILTQRNLRTYYITRKLR